MDYDEVNGFCIELEDFIAEFLMYIRDEANTEYPDKLVSDERVIGAFEAFNGLLSQKIWMKMSVYRVDLKEKRKK